MHILGGVGLERRGKKPGESEAKEGRRNERERSLGRWKWVYKTSQVLTLTPTGDILGSWKKDALFSGAHLCCKLCLG